MIAIDHINRAMFLIGVTSPVNPAKPELIQEAFKSLQDLIGGFLEDGFTVLNVIIPFESSDEMNGDFWSNPVIQFNLAVAIAPLFQVPVPTDVFDDAGKHLQDLISKQALISALPTEINYPVTLPVGAGNSSGRFSNTFFTNADD